MSVLTAFVLITAACALGIFSGLLWESYQAETSWRRAVPMMVSLPFTIGGALFCAWAGCIVLMRTIG
jgi:hypothetical protein